MVPYWVILSLIHALSFLVHCTAEGGQIVVGHGVRHLPFHNKYKWFCTVIGWWRSVYFLFWCLSAFSSFNWLHRFSTQLDSVYIRGNHSRTAETKGKYNFTSIQHVTLINAQQDFLSNWRLVINKLKKIDKKITFRKNNDSSETGPIILKK